ncbi:MAG: acyltransferase [Nitrospinota bacterium]
MSKVHGHSLLETTKPSEEAIEMYDRFIEQVRKRIESGENRNVICTETLMDIYNEDGQQTKADSFQSTGSLARLLSLDPGNVTLEPEYYHNIDREKFARVKPLIWLWMMFDRSPAGRNLHLGLRFRRMLAGFIFRKIGADVKIFQNVEVSFGYNIEIGEGTVIHRDVMLDDRGEILIGKNVSVSDKVSIYSHSHSASDIHKVSLGKTVIGEGARIMFHSTVLSGVQVGKNSTLGAHGLATRNIGENEICIGLPAKAVRKK